MKTLNYIILYFFSVISFAGTNQDNKAILYCPQEIDCATDKQLNSCKLIGDHSQYWQIKSNDGSVKKGTYNLKKVTSVYQLDGWINDSRSLCQYNNVDGNTEKFISAEKNIPINIEASLDYATLWSVAGYKAECFSNNSQLCPLRELPELAIFIDNSRGWDYNITLRTKIKSDFKGNGYDAVLAACGNVSQCDIEVHGNKGDGDLNFGTVTVDLTKDNVIKIVRIFSNNDVRAGSTKYKCKMVRKEPFNAIAIELQYV